MSTPPALPDWTGVDSTDRVITTSATPPAKAEYLVAARAIVHGVATGPYVGCALLCDSMTSATSERRYHLPVPVAARHLRLRLVATGDTSGAPDYYGTHTSWSASGGTAGADVVTSKAPLPGYPFGLTGAWGPGLVERYLDTGDLIDDAPATTRDRQLELGAPTTQSRVEQIKTSPCACVTAWTSERVADTE